MNLYYLYLDTPKKLTAEPQRTQRRLSIPKPVTSPEGIPTTKWPLRGGKT